MKQLCKRSLALLMVLVMVVGLLPAITFQTEAASYTYNWGTRGTVADEDDFTRSTAEEWYDKYNTSYSELSALSGASSTSSVPSSALYTELKSLMTSAHSYKTSYDATKSMYQYTDCQNGGGKISSFYSGAAIGPGWGEGGSWNREHTWPKSKSLNGSSNGGQDEDDIIMLRPTATSENSSRGNTAYGESGSYYDPNDESSGTYNLRGDCARIVLYVYVRWGNTSYMWGTSGVMESKEVLLKWMEEDPVDTWELGRNDAVQSITGTRNVFVDYPELAFQLFNENVPAGYDTPSGGAVSYTITATSNNTSYGTVSVSGKTITATPKTGYYASGYTVTSGSATVTQNGNTFTVNASSNCTVRINFAARQKVTVSFAGADVKSEELYAGDKLKLPTVTAPEGYTFLGWMTSKLSTDTTTKPTNYYTDFFTPTASTTLYTLYTYSVGGSGATEYVLTDLADISDTDSVVVTMTTNAGTTYALTSANGSSSAPTAVAVTVADSKLSAEPADALKWNIVGDDSFIIYPEGNRSIWLYSTNDNNGIRIGTTATNTFVVDSQYGYLQNTSYNRYVGVYNNDNWRSYTSMHSNISNQTLGFYVKTASGTTYYTSNPVKCEHANTEDVAAVAATCTTSGYTAGVYCNDCETYISGHQVIEALGHSYDSGKITTVPTCTANGVKTYTCGTCGATKTASVSATGHNYVLSGNLYTCSNCGDSYDTYFISFQVPAGVTAVKSIEYQEGGITLPSAGVPTGDYTYTFAGWATAPVEDTEEETEFYQAGEKFTATGETKLYAVYTYAVGGSGSSDYVLTDIANISATDTVVVTMTTGNGTVYALTSANGTGKAPTGVVITVSGDKLVAEPADALKWNIGGTKDAYIFYPAGQTSTWLYCTSTNNGVRVGTTSDNTFQIDATSGYLRHNGTNRYVGVYTSNPDWRCYTSTSVNIGGQTLGFYVKGEAGTLHYTSLDAYECKHDEELAVEVAPTLTQHGYIQYVCADCGEELYEEDVLPAYEMNWNMTLKSDLSVNFQIGVHEALQETLQIQVSFDGKTDTYVGSCTASVQVAAAQMADEITIIFTLGEETETKTYTVKQYAHAILADAAKSQYHQIVKDMLNYGAAAQTYFDYNAGNLVNGNIIGAGTAEVPSAAGSDVVVSGEVSGVTFYGATLLYRNKLAVRFYFTVSGNIADYTFKVGETAYKPVLKDGKYYVEIGDINPQDWDKSVTVVVNDALSVSYSPMNYIVRMDQKGNDTLKALLKAMYNYHLAAKAVAEA